MSKYRSGCLQAAARALVDLIVDLLTLYVAVMLGSWCRVVRIRSLPIESCAFPFYISPVREPVYLYVIVSLISFWPGGISDAGSHMMD